MVNIIKEDLDKQLDRIKTAYIKGILRIEDFGNEINDYIYEQNYGYDKDYDNFDIDI